jgi:hypothetical protein
VPSYDVAALPRHSQMLRVGGVTCRSRFVLLEGAASRMTSMWSGRGWKACCGLPGVECDETGQPEGGQPIAAPSGQSRMTRTADRVKDSASVRTHPRYRHGLGHRACRLSAEDSRIALGGSP